MRTALIAITCALTLAACGSAASPGQPAPVQPAPTQIGATPAAQQTPLPSSTPAQGGYEGY